MRAAIRAAMRAMRAKKSVIARGKLAMFVVFRGTKTKTKTTGGLKKTDLVKTKSKSGKIVCRKRRTFGKKAYARICGWTGPQQWSRLVRC